MKEITRIHIAKTSYDIEVAAKKELEKYTTKLELYANDPNLLEDIEIRLTEILSSRGVEKDCVITTEDVTAIREQLGDPKDFISESSDMAIGPDAFDDDNKPPRRLYRDPEMAVFGGVLSGLAKYFGVSPIWTRLLFVIACLMSGGIAVSLYIILWAVVPPAKTAAEKLELMGEPVTLASIKAIAASDNTPNKTPQILQNIVIYTTGAFAALGAAGTFLLTLWAAGSVFWGDHHSTIREYFSGESISGHAAYVGFTLSGLLLTALLTVLATALFKKMWTKRLTLTTIAIVIAGILCFGGSIGSFVYEQWRESTSAHDAQSTEKVALADTFQNVKDLTVNIGVIHNGWGDYSDISTEYIVSDTPRYELSAVRGTLTPNMQIDGEKATLTISSKHDRRNRYVRPTLIIYGPQLDNVTVKSGSLRYANKQKQAALSVTTENNEKRTNRTYSMRAGGSFEAAGSFETIRLMTNPSTSVTLSNATIENFDATIQGGYVTAGVVRTLAVRQADVCPTDSASSSQNRIVVRNVVSGKFTYNGAEHAVKTIANDCGEVIFGEENEYETNRKDY